MLHRQRTTKRTVDTRGHFLGTQLWKVPSRRETVTEVVHRSELGIVESPADAVGRLLQYQVEKPRQTDLRIVAH